MNSGCHIYGDFKRPSRELLEGFRTTPVANIDDNMGRTAAVSYDIRRISHHTAQMVGTAFTVKVPEGDNLMFHKAMDMAQPGDVIMIDAGGASERSIFGGLMASYCKKRGIVGLVVDGSIRDADELAELEGVSIYAKGITPNGPYKNGPGELRGVISVGGRVVHPGDIVVGDGDGVIVIPQDCAEAVLKAAQATVKKEAGIMQGILRGEYVRPWVDEKLAEIGCTED